MDIEQVNARKEKLELIGCSMNKLNTLEKHNSERRNIYIQSNDSIHNGIACPVCGKELYDTCPNETLTSNPPQKRVHCDCGYSGYRVQ